MSGTTLFTPNYTDWPNSDTFSLQESTVTTGATGPTGPTGPAATTNATPASATATGVKGSIEYDGSFLYVCVATNTWLRVAIATW